MVFMCVTLLKNQRAKQHRIVPIQFEHNKTVKSWCDHATFDRTLQRYLPLYDNEPCHSVYLTSFHCPMHTSSPMTINSKQFPKNKTIENIVTEEEKKKQQNPFKWEKKPISFFSVVHNTFCAIQIQYSFADFWLGNCFFGKFLSSFCALLQWPNCSHSLQITSMNTNVLTIFTMKIMNN